MIKKDPLDRSSFVSDLHFFTAARVGFRHLLKHLAFDQSEKLLLPSYIGVSVNEGSGVFDPVVECDIRYDFYTVNKDLSINLTDLEEKLTVGDVKAVLIIHYFGIMQTDISLIAGLCRTHGALLIEDCAHTLTSSFNGTPLGEFGDFSFFSVHKILPIEDGGMLKINNSSYRLPGPQKADNMSGEALDILFRSRLGAISEKRRKNYQLLASKLRDKDEIEILYPWLGDSIVPLNFPTLLKYHERESVYFELRDRGVEAVALYYKLIHPIREEEFSISHDIAKRILNLPIHQDISEEDIDYMYSHFCEILRNS